MVVDRYGVERAELPGASRHYLAMRRLIESCSLDSLAIRCWPELPGPAGLSQWVGEQLHSTGPATFSAGLPRPGPPGQ